MNEVILLLGGNQGDRFGYIFSAISRLKGFMSPVHSSSFYLTEPWGIAEQPWFINVCLNMRSECSPEEVLERIQKIELDLGRRRDQKWGPRSLDIDILAYNNAIISLPQLQVPHPELPRRRFALLPMNEACPDWIHPLLNKGISDLVAACGTDEKVFRL